MSDCNGATSTHQINTGDQGFHSLPRQGARICLQKLEAGCSSSTYLMASGSTTSLPYQVTMHHASPDSQHVLHLRQNTADISRSDKFYGFQIECQNASLGNMVSNHNSSTSSLNACSVLQNARNLSSVHSSQSFDTEDTPLYPMSFCPSDHPLSISGTSCSASISSCCQSSASLHMATETESQCSTLDGRNYSPNCVCEDSDMSESSIHSCSTLTPENWTYKAAPMGQCTSRCSSPISIVCSSLEHSPKKTDTISLSSVDTERCNTYMHLASDCKSYSLGSINKACNTIHNFYECREHNSYNDHSSLHRKNSLTCSISLRKAKKPPLPPKRNDSLQRKPHRKPYQNEKLLNEQLISSLHQSLKSHSASFSGQIPLSGLKDSWVMGARSHSSLSVASSGMSAPAAMCPTTPTHSDCSSQHSEYTKSLEFHMDFPQSCSEHASSSQIINPAYKENSRYLESNGPPSACIKTGINSKIDASPDKVQLITSPSSGYSSQSITPIAGTPVTSLLRAKSPRGRPKPKVPERKSSLRSVISSNSTHLSSYTLDSVKNLPKPPPLPKTLSGSATLQYRSDNPLPSFANVSPITPVLLAIRSNSDEKQSSSPMSSPEECTTSISFSPDSSFTSEVSSLLMLNENKMSPLPFLPLSLSSSLHSQPLIPHSSGTGLKAVTIIKATESSICLDTMENGNEVNSRQSGIPAVHERPVITAQALQRVQLRPVKLMKLENIFTDIITTVCGPDNQEHNKEPKTTTDKLVDTKIIENVTTHDSVSLLQNGMNTIDFPSKKFTFDPVSVLCEPATHSSVNILELSLDSGLLSTAPVYSNNVHSAASPCASNGILHGQSSPISPILHHAALNDFEHYEVTSSGVSFESEMRNSRSLTDAVKQLAIPLQLEIEDECVSQNSTPVSPRSNSLSSEISSDSLTDPQHTGLTLSDQDIRLYDKDLGMSDKDCVLNDGKGIPDDSLSSSSGSVIFKEEENDENGEFFLNTLM